MTGRKLAERLPIGRPVQPVNSNGGFLNPTEHWYALVESGGECIRCREPTPMRSSSLVIFPQGRKAGFHGVCFVVLPSFPIVGQGRRLETVIRLADEIMPVERLRTSTVRIGKAFSAKRLHRPPSLSKSRFARLHWAFSDSVGRTRSVRPHSLPSFRFAILSNRQVETGFCHQSESHREIDVCEAS